MVVYGPYLILRNMLNLTRTPVAVWTKSQMFYCMMKRLSSRNVVQRLFPKSNCRTFCHQIILTIDSFIKFHGTYTFNWLSRSATSATSAVSLHCVFIRCNWCFCAKVPIVIKASFKEHQASSVKCSYLVHFILGASNFKKSSP